MTTTFRRQLDELNRLLLQMASESEEMLERSLEALLKQNSSMARVVIRKDRNIDALELTIDAHILHILALHQPVAADLRFLLSAQKINNDLERISDHAVNIAEASIALVDSPPITTLMMIPKMAELSRIMVKEVIDSLVYRDTIMAHTVKRQDDLVDELYNSAKGKVAELAGKRPETSARAIQLLSIATDLERVADLATNIAEEVIFIADAEVTRHEEVESV